MQPEFLLAHLTERDLSTIYETHVEGWRHGVLRYLSQKTRISRMRFWSDSTPCPVLGSFR